MLGAYGGAEFSTPNLDRFAAARHALHQPRHRFTAVHARPPRHPLRRARLPLEAVGFDRAVGGVDHGHAAPGRGHDDARVRSSPPVRDRRRELPHRLQRLGLRPWPRGRPVAHRRRPVGVRDALHATASPGRRRRWMVHPRALRDRRRQRSGAATTTTPARGSAPRTTSPVRARCARPRRGCAIRPAPTTGGCCSSTSSTRTSRSTRPSHGRRCTTTSRGTTTG